MSKITELRRLNQKARTSQNPKFRYEYDRALYHYARRRRRNRLAETVAQALGIPNPSCADCLKYLMARTAEDDRRLRWKHLAALRYACARGVHSKDVVAFIRANGGINGCARRNTKGDPPVKASLWRKSD